MQVSHIETINKYEKLGSQARDMASRSLPRHLLGKIALEAIDHKALAAFKSIDLAQERSVSWDWNFSSRYKIFYPKAFDLSVWHGSTLCSMTLGRPTYRGTAIRLDFIERFNKHVLFANDMFPVSLLAYEAYARLIGATQIRIMDPLNEKLVKYYSSHGGFTLRPGKQGVPHYLVKNL
ncbi:hypothetical protein [uncultured Microbulbifer sp.]|uniref:hypothetical protein n=1 Tax=uncultured Microbulbifer sp. TaxID=348147 RepID=UPI00262FF6AC|nr:hypothetical protein [uncultured Microbulbifer sp.]